MKKLPILLAFTFFPLSWTHAQVTTPSVQIDLGVRTEEYCEVRVIRKSLFRTAAIARIDFGQGDEFLKDEQGKEIEFASNVAVLNYLNSRGWKLVNVHNRIWDGDSHTYYVMRRSLE